MNIDDVLVDILTDIYELEESHIIYDMADIGNIVGYHLSLDMTNDFLEGFEHGMDARAYNCAKLRSNLVEYISSIQD